MTGRSVEIVKPGLQTTVQELPGRIGYWEQGFPPSGPVDTWSFRLANLLVGNGRDTAALECQFLGPALVLSHDGVVSVTGADMTPTLDGAPVEMWQSIAVRAGQKLELGAARTGARSYVAFSGGIDTPPVLGSRAVFHMAEIGGAGLKAGDSLPLGTDVGHVESSIVIKEARPAMTADRTWTIECMLGPNDDWLHPDSIDEFLASEWVVQAKSSRTGIRLTGPEFRFSERATNKRPDHGQDPSNIIDHGYPLGAVNLAGQTPIILINDAPSTGGFINPFTVVSAAFWKLGQTRPHERLRFRAVSMQEAQSLRREIDRLSSSSSLLRLESA